MKLTPRFKDPVTLKRLRRFRRHKRAYWSMWVLIILYAISLGSELICNDRPLYVRFKGRSYFPVFKFYPENIFTGSGKQTRPDYKSLKESSLFRDDTKSFLIFTPVPYGPLESIDASSLASEERVTVTFTRVPHVGNVNVSPNFTIVQASSSGHFFNTTDVNVTGLVMTEQWAIDARLRDAVAARFRNEQAPAISIEMVSSDGRSLPATVSLSRFSPRRMAPTTVRLTFREPDTSQRAEKIFFAADMETPARLPPLWNLIEHTQRADLLSMVRTAFTEPVYPSPVAIESHQYTVSIEKNDISWPHAPVRGHFLGIDNAGRDVFARILYGLRTSMTFGFLLVCAAMLIGTIIGSVQGYYGGKIDIVGQRLIEIWSAMPFLYVIILLGSVYGRSFILLLVCYGIFNWIGMSYYMRAEFLRLRNLPFVDAAKCMGIRTPRIIQRHILPNALTPIVTFFPFSLVGAIGSLAALDYLGFGLPPPTPSWGELLHQAQQFRWAWWLILYPSLSIFIVMLLGVFVGEGVRDAFDPRPFSKME